LNAETFGITQQSPQYNYYYNNRGGYRGYNNYGGRGYRGYQQPQRGYRGGYRGYNRGGQQVNNRVYTRKPETDV